MTLDRETKRRFWEKVDVPADEFGCWEWTASRNKDGYGHFGLNGKIQTAHRVAWQFANGPIPKGEGAHGTCVLHKCDNPACVRPDHLFLGSNADNVRDRDEKGRRVPPKGETHSSAKLTIADIYAIRSDPRLQREIAAEYGVSKAHVGRIKTRRSWAHLPEQAAK